MDRFVLFASTSFFLFGFVFSIFSLKGGVAKVSRANTAVLILGFLLQTAFLTIRGKELGRCPLTSLRDCLIFLSWATVLFYFLIGNSYRMSLLGIFTAPVAFVLQVLALLLPAQNAPMAISKPSPWLEFHAAFAVLAYGAFALSGIAGGLYLWQERQLKTRDLKRNFFQYPPIFELGKANLRLMIVGFSLLTLALAAGSAALGIPKSQIHFQAALLSWILYGLIIGTWFARKIAPRRVAFLSIASFGLALLVLLGLEAGSTLSL